MPDIFEKAVAPPEGAICDFCSSPDVHWTYPCRDHPRKGETAVAVYVKAGQLQSQAVHITGVQRGGWCACNACHALIERGARDRLARRSGKRLMRKHPDLKLVLGNATAHCRRMQDEFWSNREGAPIFHEQRPTQDPTR